MMERTMRHGETRPGRRHVLGGGLAGLALLVGPEARAAALPGRVPFALARAEEWSLTARNGRRYRVLLSWPPGEVPEAGWPVLYALDGNAMFEVLTGACRFLPDASQGVIVAIDFPLDDTEEARRDFEYTLPVPEGFSEVRGRHGGADALLAVIEHELRPLVEAAFRIDPARRALFGHSYGGLFALHALFTRTQSFSTYLAASPSIWWGGGVLLREAESFAAHPAPHGAPPRLLMTFGSLEGRLRPDGTVVPPGGQRRIMGDNVRELAERLHALPGRFGALEVQEFVGENHGSVRAAAAGRAVPFAFLA
ncbi:alpha/beta hydrolase [Roseomonas aerophila]|uniref:Acyl-CoA:diacylglycerol acyltransferase n=1 Tax=Teichococcus aerophilus TaxID=1224513 RepID=A0ABR7RTE5_9PROT|nr:alpha/beta hydrolase-fold protein [Pseudoroseomonas aerophila]MBC9209352.1 alpha/beta hydrolase [Pseudoroseomonas aerophila]